MFVCVREKYNPWGSPPLSGRSFPVWLSFYSVSTSLLTLYPCLSSVSFSSPRNTHIEKALSDLAPRHTGTSQLVYGSQLGCLKVKGNTQRFHQYMWTLLLHQIMIEISQRVQCADEVDGDRQNER